MKNKYIMTKLQAEYKMLYSLGKIEDTEIRHMLRRCVKGIRSDLSCMGSIDALALKASRYSSPGSWLAEKSRELARVVYRDKAPDDVDLGKWVSVEIECIMPDKDAETFFVKFVRARGYAKFVTVKNDGSIHIDGANPDDCACDLDEGECECGAGSSAFGKEIVVSFKQGDWGMIQAICAKLVALGCSVNKSCGLHVHFDCRHLAARAVTTLGRRVAQCVPALKQMLPVSRQNNGFCREVVNSHKGGSRYAFVNLHSYAKHKTLEIRGHSGTIDADKIVYWIQVLSTIMAKRSTKAINTASELVDYFAMPSELKAYVLARAAKFTPVVPEILDLQGNPTGIPVPPGVELGPNMAGDDVADDQASSQAAMPEVSDLPF